MLDVDRSKPSSAVNAQVFVETFLLVVGYSLLSENFKEFTDEKITHSPDIQESDLEGISSVRAST